MWEQQGWYKAVFLKKTQTIILSFDEYNNVLNYDALWLILYYCQCKIRLFITSVKLQYNDQ
jgi:hypothetical protein